MASMMMVVVIMVMKIAMAIMMMMMAWLRLALIRFQIGFARRVPGSRPGSAWLGFVFR